MALYYKTQVDILFPAGYLPEPACMAADATHIFIKSRKSSPVGYQLQKFNRDGTRVVSLNITDNDRPLRRGEGLDIVGTGFAYFDLADFNGVIRITNSNGVPTGNINLKDPTTVSKHFIDVAHGLIVPETGRYVLVFISARSGYDSVYMATFNSQGVHDTWIDTELSGCVGMAHNGTAFYLLESSDTYTLTKYDNTFGITGPTIELTEIRDAGKDVYGCTFLGNELAVLAIDGSGTPTESCSLFFYGDPAVTPHIGINNRAG